MIARADRVDRRKVPREDHYVHLYGVKWADYLRLLEIRGERAVPRLTYIEGTLEIMSPSRTHDEIKSYIGCLVEAWCPRTRHRVHAVRLLDVEEQERRARG